ncbi:MAG: J domain-containing protein [Proteobacteria bacterium]|nr:J domain-containing protein [Pseudomonadota bacterium]
MSAPSFDAEALLGTTSALLLARGDSPAAQFLAKAVATFAVDSVDYSTSEEPWLLRLNISPAVFGALDEPERRRHEEAIAEAVREVMKNFDDCFLTRVSILPKITKVGNWREKVLAGQDVADGAELPIFLFWSKSASSFQILGVSPRATDEQLKAAQKQRLVMCHPDRNQDRQEAAHEATIRVNRAYESIVEERRARADAPF